MIAPIEGAADWRGPDLLARQDWVRRLTPEEVAEIDAALRRFRAGGADLGAMRPQDFPLPRLQDGLREVQEDLERGAGLVLLRGFPVERYADADLRAIFWGLGLHLGTAVPQSRRHDLIGDVRNLNIGGIYTTQSRGYTSNESLSYHTDLTDVAALFCLRVARSGGLSLVASSVAVHNEMLRRRPDLAQALYQPMAFSRMGSEGPGQAPWYEAPVFSVHEGHFSCGFSRVAEHAARVIPGAPQPSEAQRDGIALLEEIAASPEFVLGFALEPGDLQLVNSHVTLHSRTHFEDWPEPERRRHLLRLWLAMPNSRPLSPLLQDMYRDTRPGAPRGGYLVTDSPRRFTTAEPAVATTPT